ncbi:MAG: 4-(cytidine 5'-diphospho)-2-C-methyl-D-erythritol kinase [Gloeobacteraceae cyanobacterium ES-bin-144]|nr:4-(cytidine 5'-diphospho)-2-C-methyl-D-erythritol kinase [Verrucomicrobiales bacterium]
MNTLTLHAPAKLNLSLRVLRKREDDFHEIDTVMVKLPSLADQLTFCESHEFSFTCDDSSLPGDDQNLVVKAVRAYEAATGIPCRFSIALKKIIPHGAGLGGGSSDAATTLLGLDQLHDHKLGASRLHEIAASLGSDIPYFLTPSAAHCTGRGEVIEPIPSPPALRILLLKPWFSVPTVDSYNRWSNSAEIPGVLYSPQQSSAGILINDLERPVYEKHRFLAELKQWLLERRETSAALLCGSGSTVFAILNEDADAETLAKCAHHELDPQLWHWIGITGA